MKSLELIPQIFYDLLARVLPGAIVILGIGLASSPDSSICRIHS